MGYNTTHRQFFQIYVSMPTMIPQLKRVMEEGLTLPGMYEMTSLQVRGVTERDGESGARFFCSSAAR